MIRRRKEVVDAFGEDQDHFESVRLYIASGIGSLEQIRLLLAQRYERRLLMQLELQKHSLDLLSFCSMEPCRSYLLHGTGDPAEIALVMKEWYFLTVNTVYVLYRRKHDDEVAKLHAVRQYCRRYSSLEDVLKDKQVPISFYSLISEEFPLRFDK
ncbi:hypothetical protein RCL1_006939 [Eukaryota sp. TZLM3-RCL]